MAKVAEARNWEAELAVDLEDGQLTPEAETAVFRIVQEALSNARKYAETDRIFVKLDSDEDAIHLVVKDWGKGFELSSLNGGSGNDYLGVVGMEERAKLLGGEFEISSGIGQGTQIEVKVPLYENDH